MSDHSFALELENTMDSILLATKQVSTWLEQVAAPAECQELAAITLEEIVLNCIKYGYDDEARHTIEVSWVLGNDRFRMTIRDDGHPFNPLEAPPPNLTDNLEDRPIGGLGIYLLRQLWSDIEYRRQDGRNCLTLTKSLVDAALN